MINDLELHERIKKETETALRLINNNGLSITRISILDWAQIDIIDICRESSFLKDPEILRR